MRAQVDAKISSHKGSNAHFIRLTCKICGTVRREERRAPRQDPASSSHRRGSQGTQRTHAKDIFVSIVEITLILFLVRSTTLWRQHGSAYSNRHEELADRVSRDTKQQIDLATRLMLEQVSPLSDGDYDQSVMVQLFLSQPRHQLHLFRSESNPCISMTTKH